MEQIQPQSWKARIRKTLPWLGFILVLLGCLRMMSWSYDRIIQVQLRRPDAPTGWVQATLYVLKSMKDQVHQLQVLDLENEKLKLELESLRAQFQKYQFEVETERGLIKTQHIENRLSRETGLKVGRTLPALSYRPPRDLPPAQLFTLALTYVKAFEDEKAAVILSNLTALEQTDFYRTPEVLLLTGLVWYRIDHRVMAEAYFDEVLRQKKEASALPYFAQARLWKAILAKHKEKESDVQYWLGQLLENHPHSLEVQWVNPIGEEYEKRKNESKSH
jgi:hypothetical protein